MTAALMAASSVAASCAGGDAAGYALAYGSHATGLAHGDSDLDLLFVGAQPMSTLKLDRLARQVIALHREHGLKLDTEVAHDAKLYATLRDVDAALALGGFIIAPAGELYVPELVAEPWFLNSVAFKLRLILNTLTSGHVFLGGNVACYRQHRARADRTLGLLAASLLAESDSFTVEDAIAALTQGPGGAHGKDHLGYLPCPALYGTLRRALADLTTAQMVTTVDGCRFSQHHDRRRAMLADLTRRARRDPCSTAAVEHSKVADRPPPVSTRLTR